MLTAYVRARRPDGAEVTIDLFELEAALEGGMPARYYFVPDSGRIITRFRDDDLDDLDEEEDETADNTEALEIDPIESRVRFQWMEDFAESVHSVTARSALGHALQVKRPFRSFKDALSEYPALRQQWFQFQAQKLKEEAISLIECFDCEVLEVVDPRPQTIIGSDAEPAERVPLTEEEYEWILRGASEIAAKGGRSQLSLLLKGSKSKAVLKYHLDSSPAYGKLSFLTVEEIENRIDQVIRKGVLVLHYLGGDLPLIVLSDSAWERVRPWANQQEATRAAAADDRTLNDILLSWRNRRREEQVYLIDAVASLDAEAARRLFQAWHQVAGKEMRAKLEERFVQRFVP
jgi:uncharacterized protein UPF0158/RQC domain-containing protein